MSTAILSEGKHSADYLPIYGHVLDIPKRIKEIDERFFVVLNRRSGLFEVHVRGQAGTTLGCVLPFETLDARSVDYVRSMLAARLSAIVAEIDAHNERLAYEAEAGHMDKAAYKLKNGIQYLDRHPSAEDIPKELIDE